MERGFFLGVANNVSDIFSYVIISELELDKYKKCKQYVPQTLIRSVVRLRKLKDSAAPICSKTADGFHFYDINGHTLVGDRVLEWTTLLLPLNLQM